MYRTFLSLGLACGLMAGCNGSGLTEAFDPAGRMLANEALRGHQDGPPGAEPGTCWGRDVTPAVVETVTRQVIIQPPEIDSSGVVRAGPVYRTETRQRIVQEREEIWFRAPCEDELTPERIETLQRALAARGHYRGAVSGRMDLATRRAIRDYQRPQGLNSGLLSLRAARQLGIVEYDFARG